MYSEVNSGSKIHGMHVCCTFMFSSLSHQRGDMFFEELHVWTKACSVVVYTVRQEDFRCPTDSSGKQERLTWLRTLGHLLLLRFFFHLDVLGRTVGVSSIQFTQQLSHCRDAGRIKVLDFRRIDGHAYTTCRLTLERVETKREHKTHQFQDE